MQSAEIGHFSLRIDDKEFNLIPSLRNMAKLASAKRIISLYNTIHSHMVPDWVRLDIARDVLLCCSDSEAIDKYLIKSRRMKPVLNKYKISINDQVVVAAALMRHGISGVNRPEYEGSKGSSKPMTEFNVNKIVADAQIHFNLSEEEALNLTMSKFCHLLASKFPPKSANPDVPSMDDHKAAMKMLMEDK